MDNSSSWSGVGNSDVAGLDVDGVEVNQLRADLNVVISGSVGADVTAGAEVVLVVDGVVVRAGRWSGPAWEGFGETVTKLSQSAVAKWAAIILGTMLG